jgi:predicted nucleic acid-binding protein
MVRYLLDTNVISHYLSLLMPDPAIDFLDKVMDKVPQMSVITKIELLCWTTDKLTEQRIIEFVNDSHVWGITPIIVENCIALRKKRRIRTPDAIIAATAMEQKMTLITNNVVDFANIKGLRLLNPHEI